MESTRVKYGTTERIFATMADSSGVPVTGLTDVLLEIYRKSDGKYFDFNSSTFKSSAWTTRQGAMTELNSSLSPGVYYYNFDTTNHTSQFVEECFLLTVTSSTASNDPLYGELKVGGYVDQIGISSGVIQYGKGKGMSLEQVKKLAEEVWGYVLKNDKTAAETLLSKSEFNAATDKVMMDLVPMMEKMDSVKMADRTDEVLGAISSIPKPKDLSKDIKSVGLKVEGLVTELKPIVTELKPIVTEFTTTVGSFKTKIDSATNKVIDEIGSSIKAVTEIKNGVVGLNEMLVKYGDTLSTQTDMDRRMSQFMSKIQEKDLESINDKLKAMMKMITEAKYDILSELK